MDLGLFTSLSSPSIPSTVKLVRTSGFSSEGRGQAEYAYDSSLAPSYVSSNPLTSFTDATSPTPRVFRLAETVRTPYMFGAAGDGTTDDTAELQAFFDDAFPAANAETCTYDFTGTWGVSGALYACYDPGDPFISRRFRMGTLNVLAGSNIDHVLTIGGCVSGVFEGELFINGGSQVYYASRRFQNGVRLITCNSAYFESIRVESAKRDAVILEDLAAPTTFRTGTPLEVQYPYSNNIGIRIEKCHARYSGSASSDSRYGLIIDFDNVVMGSGEGANFTTDFLATFQGSTSQRSRVTIDPTTELRVNDLVSFRIEKTPAHYTTIAADNGGSTFTWSSGDPTAGPNGLVVGDKIIPQSGANAGYTFEITGFSGTSNRQISVSPRPVTEAATAISAVYTELQTHLITEIVNSTTITLYPWVDPRFGSGKLYSRHGFVANVLGGNTANSSFGLVEGLVVGGTLHSAGGYGCRVSTMLAEYAEFAIVHGRTHYDVALGLVVDHIHSEVVNTDYLQVAMGPQNTFIKGASAWGNLAATPPGASAPSKLALCDTLRPRWFTSSTGRPPTAEFRDFRLVIGGEEYSSTGLSGPYSGTTQYHDEYALSNRPGNDERQILADAGSIHLDWDEDAARCIGNANKASVHWCDADGTAPSGSLTFTLSAGMTNAGWSIVGTNPVTTTAPCRIDVRYHRPTRKVLLTRFAAS